MWGPHAGPNPTCCTPPHLRKTSKPKPRGHWRGLVLNARHPSPSVHACRFSLISTNHSVMGSTCSNIGPLARWCGGFSHLTCRPSLPLIAALGIKVSLPFTFGSSPWGRRPTQRAVATPSTEVLGRPGATDIYQLLKQLGQALHILCYHVGLCHASPMVEQRL